MFTAIAREGRVAVLLRALAFAAIAGGVLRGFDSFAATLLAAAPLGQLYFATDVLLLLGIAGVYASRRTEIGIAGTIGSAIFAAGILVVRVSAVLGPNGYQLGAAIALLGLAILSGETLLRRQSETVSAVLWLLALALGIASTFGSSALAIAAGLAFAAGFVAAGIEILAV